MISVRNGQAGFFSNAELADSDGVLWDAADDAPARALAATHRRRSPPSGPSAPPTWRPTSTVTPTPASVRASSVPPRIRATPSLPKGQLRLFDEIAEFDPEGGPWGRGYLRARAHVPADSWFYNGHFKNDPCMPGTLMADAATQALSFAMAAYGFTIEHDGWRFEPVPDEMSRFVCRGQVIPDADHTLDYEVFIEEIVDGPIRRCTPHCCAAATVSRCSTPAASVSGWSRTGRCPGAPARCTSWKAPPTFAATTVRCSPVVAACPRTRSVSCTGCRSTARVAPRLPDEPYHFVSRIISVDSPPGCRPRRHLRRRIRRARRRLVPGRHPL